MFYPMLINKMKITTALYLQVKLIPSFININVLPMLINKMKLQHYNNIKRTRSQHAVTTVPFEGRMKNLDNTEN